VRNVGLSAERLVKVLSVVTLVLVVEVRWVYVVTQIPVNIN